MYVTPADIQEMDMVTAQSVADRGGIGEIKDRRKQIWINQ